MKNNLYEPNYNRISPSANVAVAFTWSSQYPQKKLEIWLYDDPELYAQWLLSLGDSESEEVAKSEKQLLEVIKQYQES